MGNKEKNIVEAAIRTVSRYGVRRTTMSDIASEAGVSRQTLYASYSCKEQIMTACLRHMADEKHATIQCEWKNVTTLSEKLDIFFQYCVVEPFNMLKAMPDSEDLYSGFNAAAMAELERANQEKKGLLETLFSDAAIAGQKVSTSDLAEMTVRASGSFKYEVGDEEHLKRLLDALKTSVLAALKP
ncbi:MAG: TetR/AcrR family transcriptional regulator [Pseudomonadota bacterium]